MVTRSSLLQEDYYWINQGFLCSQDQKSNLDWPEQGGKASGAAPRVGRGQNYQLQGPRLRPALHQPLFSAFVWFSWACWPPSVLRKQTLCILGGTRVQGQARTPIGQNRGMCSPFCPGRWYLFPGEGAWECSQNRTVTKPCLMGFWQSPFWATSLPVQCFLDQMACLRLKLEWKFPELFYRVLYNMNFGALTNHSFTDSLFHPTLISMCLMPGSVPGI